MGHGSPDRGLRVGLSVAAATLGALLVIASPGFAKVRTVHHTYRVYGVDYAGKGDMTGIRGEDACAVGNSALTGVVTTKDDPGIGPFRTDFTPFNLKIHGRSVSGGASYKLDVSSVLSNSRYHEVTACDSGYESAWKDVECAQQVDSFMKVAVLIGGRVGDQVKLEWSFRQAIGPATGTLVPDSFTCGSKPLLFAPEGDCTTRAPLSTFNREYVKLPFSCSQVTQAPPPGSDATKYISSISAEGQIRLHRKS